MVCFGFPPPLLLHAADFSPPDLYNEVFEIIDSCTFAAKSISNTMWQAFELIHRTFKAGAELYLEGKFKRLLTQKRMLIKYLRYASGFGELRHLWL